MLSLESGCGCHNIYLRNQNMLNRTTGCHQNVSWLASESWFSAHHWPV